MAWDGEERQLHWGTREEVADRECPAVNGTNLPKDVSVAAFSAQGFAVRSSSQGSQVSGVTFPCGRAWCQFKDSSVSWRVQGAFEKET